jgi:phosphoglycolate phosphatase-like HAD superfamily hydrolase
MTRIGLELAGIIGMLFDLDQTLSNWPNYYCRALMKIRRKLAVDLGLSQEEFGRRLGRILQKYKTHEYPWCIPLAFAAQWVSLGGGRNRENFVQYVERRFWDAVLASLRRNLTQPYEGVPDMLTEAQAQGVRKLGIFSNGPDFMVDRRLRAIGLADTFDAVYAIRYSPPDEEDLATLPGDPKPWLQFGHDLVTGLTREHGGLKVIGLDPSFMKPKPDGLLELMRKLGISDPATCLYLGDALSDMLAARAAGMRPCLAPWDRWEKLKPWQKEVLIDFLHVPPGHTGSEAGDEYAICLYPKVQAAAWASNGVTSAAY